VRIQRGTPLLGKDERGLVVVEGLLVEDVQKLNYSSFYNAVPILRNNRAVVHYTKISISDSSRFSSVVKILKQATRPKGFNLMPILREFEHASAER
jgi:hypothetical protein